MATIDKIIFNKEMKTLKNYENYGAFSTGLDITKVFGKDILGKKCEYYGEDLEFKVYNKEEDWIITFSRSLSSTDRLFRKGTDITLYENISSNYNDWDYALEPGYGDYSENKILTQPEFLSYLRSAFDSIY